MTQDELFKVLVAHCKEYGFIFPSSEIYDGLAAVYDYGQMGVELKNNIKRYWWESMTRLHENVVGIDSCIFMHPKTWVASGHVAAFNDPLIDNKDSKKRYRADNLIEDYLGKIDEKIEKEVAKGRKKFGENFDEAKFRETNPNVLREKAKYEAVHSRYVAAEQANDLNEYKQIILDCGIVCPISGTANWTDVRQFNLMFSTQISNTGNADDKIYLRPETAQGIFVEYLNVQKTGRMKIPFGIAQIGKAFRNEIVARQFIFRMREFEQMEMEFFVEPGTDEDWHQYWIDTRTRWYLDLGIKPENLRHYEHPKEKLAHYSKRTVDIEYKFGFQGSDWGELEGIANRTDFDLSAHAKHSGEDLSYFNQATGEKYVPYVIEPAAGLTRSLMAFLVDAYDVDEAPNTKGGVDKRTVLRLDPRLAPVKAAVLPLSKKPQLQTIAHNLAADLRQHEWMIDYDEAGAIGRRYRREDEIGTPLCITVDFDTIDDNAVTIRERDTMAQERVSLDKVADYVADRVSEKRVRYPEGPASVTGVKAADGGVDVSKESGIDETKPVKIAEAGGLY